MSEPAGQPRPQNAWSTYVRNRNRINRETAARVKRGERVPAWKRAGFATENAYRRIRRENAAWSGTHSQQRSTRWDRVANKGPEVAKRYHDTYVRTWQALRNDELSDTQRQRALDLFTGWMLDYGTDEAQRDLSDNPYRVLI